MSGKPTDDGLEPEIEPLADVEVLALLNKATSLLMEIVGRAGHLDSVSALSVGVSIGHLRESRNLVGRLVLKRRLERQRKEMTHDPRSV